jgi:hypothetical protein
MNDANMLKGCKNSYHKEFWITVHKEMEISEDLWKGELPTNYFNW